MASQADLAELIQTGYDLASFKLFEVALTALLVYDYFLTLDDEVLYIWKSENVPVFVLFLFTRYLPGLFQAWMLIEFFIPGYTPQTYVWKYSRIQVYVVYPNVASCAKASFASIMYFTLIVALSQVVLTLRAYAITMKNKWVAAILYTFSAVGLSLGSYIWIRAAAKPLVPVTPTAPVGFVCPPNVEKAFELAQMIFPLTFDITVFVLVIVQVKLIKSKYQGANGPMILDTINRDAEIYFAAITTCHFLTVVLYFTTRITIKGIPVMGNMLLMPMMISRMIISLKKAAASQQLHMSVEVPTVTQVLPNSFHLSDSIKLCTFKK